MLMGNKLLKKVRRRMASELLLAKINFCQRQNFKFKQINDYREACVSKETVSGEYILSTELIKL